MENEDRKRRNKELEKRIARFLKGSIDLVNRLPQNPVNRVFIVQYIKAAGSFGANYEEACSAESAKDFVHKMGISRKEVREARYWLRLVLLANPAFENEITKLGKECTEFIQIFTSIIQKFKK